MRSYPSLAALAAITVVLAACQRPPAAPAGPAALTNQDRTTLAGMFDATVRNINAGDWEAWTAQFSDDAFLQPPNAPTVQGREALLAWGHAFPPVDSTLTFGGVQVWGEGNMAYGVSTYDMTPRGLPHDTGKQLAVFRKNAAGEWKVVAVSFGSDLPVPKQ